MHTERYTFTDTESGLVKSISRTLALRRNGFKTRLVRHRITHLTTVLSVVATAPERPNRRARGCEL